MENGKNGVSNLTLERQDGIVTLMLPEDVFEATKATQAKTGKETGKTSFKYVNKFTVKEVNEGEGMAGVNQEGKPVVYQEVKVSFVEWTAESLSAKRQASIYRAIVANLKKNTGLVTKNTKGEAITVADEDKIGFTDLIRWREGELDRLPGVRFAYASLPEETKMRILKEVVAPLEKKLNKAPKFTKAAQARIMNEMLTKLVEAGIIAKPSIADMAQLIGVEPIPETVEATETTEAK